MVRGCVKGEYCDEEVKWRGEGRVGDGIQGLKGKEEMMWREYYLPLYLICVEIIDLLNQATKPFLLQTTSVCFLFQLCFESQKSPMLNALKFRFEYLKYITHFADLKA